MLRRSRSATRLLEDCESPRGKSADPAFGHGDSQEPLLARCSDARTVFSWEVRPEKRYRFIARGYRPDLSFLQALGSAFQREAPTPSPNPRPARRARIRKPLAARVLSSSP
eukprot:2494809-Prymnesium_polylepis.1